MISNLGLEINNTIVKYKFKPTDRRNNQRKMSPVRNKHARRHTLNRITKSSIYSVPFYPSCDKNLRSINFIKPIGIKRDYIYQRQLLQHCFYHKREEFSTKRQ